MTSFYPTMKMDPKMTTDVNAMYNNHRHVDNQCRPAIVKGLREIIHLRSESQTKQPIGIADFGTADGNASLSLVNEMIDTIQRELGIEQDIVVYYNDQPMNDFNLLSKVIHGCNKHIAGLDISSKVYPVIIPRTMYEQCVPDNTLDLAISTVATQYLSKQVCQIKKGVFVSQANEKERNLMQEQGKSDWRAFVISRGRELKPGGFLITMTVSVNDDKEESSIIENGLIQLGRMVSDMAEEGIITQKEYLATNCNAYFKTEADFKEPFTNAIPEVRKLGLELVAIKTFKYYFPNPVFHIVNKDEADKLEYSRQVMTSTYPWLYHVLEGGLSSSRSEGEKQTIIDHYFKRLQEYAFSHSDFKPFMIFTEVVIKKVIG